MGMHTGSSITSRELISNRSLQYGHSQRVIKTARKNKMSDGTFSMCKFRVRHL